MPEKTVNAHLTLGCDIGGTAIKLVRLRGEAVEGSLQVPTPSAGPPGRAVGAIAEALLEMAAMQGGQGKPSAGAGARVRAGVAVPGFLDASRQRVLRLSNVPCLDGVELRRELEARTPFLVTLDTDTNAGGVAEATLGAGKRFERVLYLTLGTGLGAALIVAGEPQRVSRHTVGQVAHVPLEANGPACRCGKKGCAEAVLAARGILWRARKAGLEGLASVEDLARLAGHGRMAGPPGRGKARRVWEAVGRLAGRLVVILGCLWSPDVVVLGGGISSSARLFLPAARSVVQLELDPRLGRRVHLLRARKGLLAGALGAAILARRDPPRS